MVAVMASSGNYHLPPMMAGAMQAPSDYEENGRIYHGFRKGAYMFPCDEMEKDRMDCFHKLIWLARRKVLHSAPLPQSTPSGYQAQIMDVGTGTGIWAIDIADTNRYANVMGFDLSLIQPAAIPPNLQFRRRDFELPWAGMAMDSWDMIHMRMLAGSVSSWPELYANAIRHLKPGYGWIEQVEFDWQPRCDDGSLPRDCALVQWYQLLTQATENAFKPIAYNTQTRQMLQQAGFTEVAEQVIRVPFNTWPSDPHERSIGEWCLLGLTLYLEALTLAPLFRVLNWSKARIDKLLADVNRDIRTRRYHAYSAFRHEWTTPTRHASIIPRQMWMESMRARHAEEASHKRDLWIFVPDGGGVIAEDKRDGSAGADSVLF